MNRWKSGLVILLGVVSLVTGIWYFRTAPRTAPEVPDRSAEFFFPDNPELMVRFNHRRPVLRNLKHVEMIRRFKQSRFSGSFEKRILPLLSLLTDRFKANTPYPSGQLLRYFRHSVSYLYSTREGSPVFVMTPSNVQDKQDPRKLRDLIESWILSPARNRKPWTVTRTNFRELPVWRMTYRAQKQNFTLSFSLSSVSNHGLISPSTAALKRSIKRYLDRTGPAYTVESGTSRTLVDFLVTESSPDTSTPLLQHVESSADGGPEELLHGTLSVDTPYLHLSARATLGETDPVTNVSFPGKLLGYVPPNSFALNVISVPELTESTPRNYRRFIRDYGSSILPTRLKLSEVFKSNNTMELLRNQQLIAFASHLDRTPSKKDPNQAFLLLLDPRDRERTQSILSRFATGETAGTTQGLTLGGISVFGTWDRGVYLIAGEQSTLRKAVERRRDEDGFMGKETVGVIRNRVPNEIVSFSYVTTSPLTDLLRQGGDLKNTRYQLAKTILGFDPIREVGKLVRKAPPNLIITRRNDRGNLSIDLYSAGDVFLPLALRELYPERSLSFGFLPRSLPFETD